MDRQTSLKNKNEVAYPELPLARKVEFVRLSTELVGKQTSLAGAVALCVQMSGLEEKEIYLALEIDAGHWTRIMKGEAHFPLNKLNTLVDLCGNEAPLIWWANKRGYELKQLESELEYQLRSEREKRAEAEKENELLKKLLIGRGV